jgi:hypothetical protein
MKRTGRKEPPQAFAPLASSISNADRIKGTSQTQQILGRGLVRKEAQCAMAGKSEVFGGKFPLWIYVNRTRSALIAALRQAV